MTLKTDHSFHIGEQHLKTGKPCQDYALSGMLNDELAYAIVSDGCSSGGMTDIGARLMCLATKQALIDHGIDTDTQLQTIITARDTILKQYQQTLGLDTRDLLATSMWAVAHKDWVFAHVTGDGVVVIKHKYDHIVHQLSWDKNMPYYPAYRIGDLNDSYRTAQTEATPFSHIEQGLAPIGQGGVREGIARDLSLEEGIAGIVIDRGYDDYGDDYPGPIESITLFSDGIEQIDNVSYDDAAVGLTAFKSTSGQFATRRMNRFLQDTRKNGRGPQDDIAMATIHLGRTDET